MLHVGSALADLPGPPREWQEQIDRVDGLVEEQHRQAAAWHRTQEQEKRLAHLLDTVQIKGVLLGAATV
ncbi:hypothetical protein GCM10009836_03640 [Pseudonocardia ailaonensis]|uniref:Uncharacterized protein n=1 Tax=Pseudonocardia ailaonensis TaxID=367279 RepID=A0ABN2MJW0_9PSEU